MRMSRNNPDAEAVGAAFRGWNRSAKQIMAVAIIVLHLVKRRDLRVPNAIDFHFTMVSFYAHMLRTDGPQVELGRYVE